MSRKQITKNNMIRLFKQNKILFCLFILALVLFIIFIVSKIFIKTDGMENSGVLTVKYRTYTKENGWTDWTKNGITNGDKINNIKGYEIQLKNDEGIVYSTYTEDEGWVNGLIDEDNTIVGIDSNLRAIKMSLFYGTSKKYDLCYRTYNKKNGWLEWTCENDGISGNVEENITAIQVKIIPENVVKNEYLKDFNLNENEAGIGF